MSGFMGLWFAVAGGLLGVWAYKQLVVSTLEQQLKWVEKEWERSEEELHSERIRNSRYELRIAKLASSNGAVSERVSH